MQCAICRHGTTTDGYTTIVLERDQTTVVFKEVLQKSVIIVGKNTCPQR